MTKTDIEKILAHFDPEQLIIDGAPKNEYAEEAEKLTEVLGTCESYESIEQALIEIFHENFDFAYVLADKPDGLAFTKHAIGKINFSSTSGAFTLKSRSDSKKRRASYLRDAALTIFQSLKRLSRQLEGQ